MNNVVQIQNEDIGSHTRAALWYHMQITIESYKARYIYEIMNPGTISTARIELILL